MKSTQRAMAIITALILLSLSLTACSRSIPPQETPLENKGTDSPDIYVAQGEFAPGELLPPDEVQNRHSWEIEYGTFPHMDGSILLAPAAELLAQHLLDPDDKIKNTLTDFSYKSYAMDAFLAGDKESAEIIYESELPVYLEASAPNLLLLANFTQADKAYLESGGGTVTADEFGRDALVFITQANNPVDSLMAEELTGILSGAITNWAEIGGNDLPIDLYYSFEALGLELSDLLHSRLMNGQSLIVAVSGEQNILSGIPGGDSYSLPYQLPYMNETGSIGITLLSQVGLPDTKILDIDGISPGAETLVSGSYPLYIGCYAVYWQSDRNGVPGAFADWLLSAEGAAIVEASGLIPMSNTNK